MGAASDDRPPIERLVDAALFGPLELTARVVGDLPETVDRARQQLILARFIGRLAVEQGVVELRRRIEGAHGDVGGSTATGDEAASRGEGDQRADAPDDVAPDASSCPVPEASDLALPDYEQLPATHVVAKLAGLTPAERDEIETFESAHRRRRTILGKLDQLRGSA